MQAQTLKSGVNNISLIFDLFFFFRKFLKSGKLLLWRPCQRSTVGSETNTVWLVWWSSWGEKWSEFDRGIFPDSGLAFWIKGHWCIEFNAFWVNCQLWMNQDSSRGFHQTKLWKQKFVQVAQNHQNQNVLSVHLGNYFVSYSGALQYRFWAATL